MFSFNIPNSLKKGTEGADVSTSATFPTPADSLSNASSVTSSPSNKGGPAAGRRPVERIAARERLFAVPLRTALAPAVSSQGFSERKAHETTEKEKPRMPQGVWRHPSMIPGAEKREQSSTDKVKVPQGIRLHPSMLQQNSTALSAKRRAVKKTSSDSLTSAGVKKKRSSTEKESRLSGEKPKRSPSKVSASGAPKPLAAERRRSQAGRLQPVSAPQQMTRDPREKAEILRQLRSLIGTSCPTSQHKMDILRKRDELMCKLRVRNTDVDSARVVNGCCQDMCPEKERYVRVVQKRLNAYECNEQGQMAPEKTVKDYSRSAADQAQPLPHELRPAPVLQRTLTYLIGSITDEGPSKENLVQWYDFLWSRTRSIRKDITQQMLSDRSAADLVEKCTRFHIFAAFRFAEYPATDFDQKMNTENLSKCLQTLRHMYEDLEKQGLHCENEAEFRAYDVMLNLADSNVLSQVLSYRKEVRESQPVQLSLRLASAVQNNNYIRFFRLLRAQATFLQYPLTEFADILGFNDEQEAMNFTAAFGVPVDHANAPQLSLVMGEANRYGTAHEIPDPLLTTWVMQKMGGHRLAEVLYNGRMPPVELLEPVDSFTEDGVYYHDPVLQSYMEPGELDSDAAFVRPRAAPEPLQEDRREVQVAAFVNQASESILRSVSNNMLRKIATESLQENRARVERQRAQVDRRSLRNNCIGFVRKMVESALQRACSAEIARIAEEQLSASTRQRLQTQTRALIEKKSTALLHSIAKRELRQIATEVHQAHVVDVKERLARIRNNLQKLWLKKFVYRWMDVVWSRKRYEAHIREVLESFPDKPPTNPPPMTDRPLRWYPVTIERPAAEIEFILRHRKLRERREERIAREHFHRWRAVARYRAETRSQMQAFTAPKLIDQPHRMVVHVSPQGKHMRPFMPQTDQSHKESSLVSTAGKTLGSSPASHLASLRNVSTPVEELFPFDFGESAVSERDVAIARHHLAQVSPGYRKYCESPVCHPPRKRSYKSIGSFFGQQTPVSPIARPSSRRHSTEMASVSSSSTLSQSKRAVSSFMLPRMHAVSASDRLHSLHDQLKRFRQSVLETRKTVESDTSAFKSVLSSPDTMN